MGATQGSLRDGRRRGACCIGVETQNWTKGSNCWMGWTSVGGPTHHPTYWPTAWDFITLRRKVAAHLAECLVCAAVCCSSDRLSVSLAAS